ncbi:MAG: hypothetical protein FJ096_00655 [Deltaproteobacteria bacterium]|nr:hypothetical protein [Deltaproteobacteria bacterium]
MADGVGLARTTGPSAARSLLASVLACLAPLGGCSPECVEVADDCAPLYEPSFEQVFERTLLPTCAGGGSACHGTDGGRGGLVFAERGASHAALVDGGLVLAGDPGCSELVKRLASDDPEVQMPPGSPLPASERCAIERWIAGGAAP